MTSKKYKEVSFESKQTEMFGNVQLGEYHTQDIVQIRKEFEDVLKSYYCIESYYFIVHDTNEGKDSDYIHVHFILYLNRQVRLSTMCNQLAESLHVNPLAISITKLVSIVGAIKYILHRSEESIEDGKKMYDVDELISTDSEFIIQGYLESETSDNISIRFIRDLVIECSIKSDVLIRLNNDKLIRKNRYYIDTLWNDKEILQLNNIFLMSKLPKNRLREIQAIFRRRKLTNKNPFFYGLTAFF